MSFDVNHRAALWGAETAAPALAALARRADLSSPAATRPRASGARERDDDIRALFPDVPELVVKDGDVGATAYLGDRRVFEPALRVEVVEAVGAGDAFAGGYLAARLSDEHAGRTAPRGPPPRGTDTQDDRRLRRGRDSAHDRIRLVRGGLRGRSADGDPPRHGGRALRAPGDDGVGPRARLRRGAAADRRGRARAARGRPPRRPSGARSSAPAPSSRRSRSSGPPTAGAAYLVSPGIDPVVVRAAQERGIPILPGVATPVGGAARRLARADLAQGVPAEWLGVGWFRHIRGPFPQVRFVATGGLDAGNVASFLDAGVRVAAVGSALEDPTQLDALAAVCAARADGGLASQIGETDFLLDGRPHRILSGAIHYFRVHPDLWADRIRKARLMGLNTIETYVAWNAHEPRRGEWDATGWNDLGRFLDLIAAEGMHAIVRPGPYICAEWHNGGLPGLAHRHPGHRTAPVRAAVPRRGADATSSASTRSSRRARSTAAAR